MGYQSRQGEARLQAPEPGAQSPLSFKGVRHRHGRVMVAPAGDGSFYCYGPAERPGVNCAWRDTAAGERQWIGRDISEADALTAMREAHKAHSQGAAIAVMPWPMREGSGINDVRMAVKLRRTHWGLSFEPLAQDAPTLALHSPGLAGFLKGEAHIHFPGTSPRPAKSALLVTLVAAARQAKGVLTHGERFRAGAGIALMSADEKAGAGAISAMRNGLDHLCGILAPYLDGRSAPNEEQVAAMRLTVNGLVRGPASEALGPIGRAFIVAEVSPALARAHASVIAANDADDTYSARMPAYA